MVTELAGLKHHNFPGIIVQAKSSVVRPNLFVDEGHATDLLHDGLGGRAPVGEVGRDGDGQLASKLLPLES